MRLAQGSDTGAAYDGNEGTPLEQVQQFHGLAVEAGSSEKLFGLAAALGAGFVGVAGGVGVRLFTTTTLANIDKFTTVNQTASPPPTRSVNVSAADSFRALTRSAAGSAPASSASPAVSTSGSMTAASTLYIGDSTKVNANGNVDVFALVEPEPADRTRSASGWASVERRRGGLGLDARHDTILGPTTPAAPTRAPG